jgi:hypothetical protein
MLLQSSLFAALSLSLFHLNSITHCLFFFYSSSFSILQRIQVMIMDDGEPQLSSTTRVVIKVEDVNDCAPEFDQKTYNVEVPSNAKLNQKLFQVSETMHYECLSLL